MGLFDDLQKTPELPEENELLQPRGESLETPDVAPETTEEAILVANDTRKNIEQEEGMEFGNPVDFAEQFNNTVIAAAGAPVDLITWSLNGASKILGGPELIDPETVAGGSKQLKGMFGTVGIGSEDQADTYLGYAGNTFGEAVAFMAGGAAVVQKTKQAGGVIGSLSRQADDALRTKLDTVVATEVVAAGGMAAGRQYAEENEMGATGSLLLEFTTGAMAMVSAAAAKKAVLDPLTAKLKNMTATEALETLSKEEVAEVVARGREEKAKVEPEAEAPKDALSSFLEELDNPPTPKSQKITTETPSSFKEDIPSEEWLEGKIEDVIERGVNRYGVPRTGSVTGSFDSTLELPLDKTKGLKGANGEDVAGLNQDKVDELAKVLEDGGELDPPLVGVHHDGTPYILEGNHRIAASQQAGVPIKVEVKYFDGGQRKAIDGWKPEQLKPKEAPAEPTPAPKTPEVAPTSASGDAIDESIAAVKGILEGDRTGGKGARVTRAAKRHFRAVSKEFFDDIGVLLKTKDVEAAKKILGRIDKYIEFDRIISKKDYAQGSELQANTRQAMDNGTTDYAAGISAAGNERTENLNVLKGMLQKLVDEDAPLDTKTVQKVAGDVKKKAEGAPKLSKEEKLDAVADQVAKTFVKERGGVFQQAIDAYFTFRLVQMLNSAKTSFIGIPSAIMMSVVRPIINTPYNIRKATQATGITLSRKAMYASADIASTFEYIHTMAKYHKDIARSVVDTIKNRGDSAFLYRDRHAYIKDEIAEAGEPAHAAKRRMKEAQRRVRASEAKTETGRKVLNAKATVLNSKTIKLPLFFYDYGVSLIGGLEEISLITHALRDARARGIKKAIDAGESNILKYSSDYMESAIDRSGGGFRANYDPEFADIFNTARKDHFRAMDLDPNDIRRDLVDGMVAAVNKVSSNPDEMGILARMLMVFIGVPLRAGGMGLSYVTAPYNVAKNVAGGGARRLEQSLGGAATFGKYNKKISELEMEIKGQKKLLKSEDPDVKDTAEKKIAELEDSLAFTKDLKMQKDYEDLGKLAIGTSLFLLGYEMAKNGQAAGTDSWMTEEQKLAAQKVQGAPNSWKVVLGGSEFDFRYFDPLKSVFALGADYARRQAAEEAGALTDDQTFAQFVTSYTKSIATDSPFATGARYVTQLMSPNPETQERGIMGIYRSLIPVPAEIRHFNKFDEEFVTDTTAGEFFDTTLSASIGLETGNYRLTSLGEPKIKEEPSILSYILPYGPKAVPEREPIDDILLEDAMSFRSVSDPQTSISGFKLKKFTNEDNETLYSLYGRLITETRIGGKTQRQALNALVKTRDFKNAYNNNKYTMDDKGTEINEGIEMIKDVIAEYRAEARFKILETKAASDYLDSDGNNIYDILKEREQFDEQPESLLEMLGLE